MPDVMDSINAAKFKTCRICNEHKHRSAFRLRSGDYDYWCASCRIKGNKTVNMRGLVERHIKGLITDHAFTAEKKRRMENKIKALREGVRKYHEGLTAATWERPERSAVIITAFLKRLPTATDEVMLWREEVIEMIAEARRYILENKKKEQLPERMLFWYDPVEGMYRRLLALVARYPGEDACPVSLL